jgi:hypothetical protein
MPQELFKKQGTSRKEKKQMQKKQKKNATNNGGLQRQYKKLISKGIQRMEVSLAAKAGILGSGIFKS